MIYFWKLPSIQMVNTSTFSTKMQLETEGEHGPVEYFHIPSPLIIVSFFISSPVGNCFYLYLLYKMWAFIYKVLPVTGKALYIQAHI